MKSLHRNAPQPSWDHFSKVPAPWEGRREVALGLDFRWWERASERPEMARIEELLGFHPLDLLRRLLTRER